MSGISHWSRLRITDKLWVIVLMPVWIVSLILHVQLAANDSLRTPALILGSSDTRDNYPHISEVLDGAGEIVTTANLAVGDELLSIEDIDVVGFSGFQANVTAFARLGDGNAIKATFRRGENVFDAEYPFGKFPIPWWWPSLFAISFGAVGLLVLLSAPESRTARAIFPAFVTFALTWLYFPGRSELQTVAAGAMFAVSMIFAAPLTLRAIMLLPDRSAISAKWPYSAIWLFALMALAGTSSFIGYPFSASVGQKAHLVFISLFYLAILAVLARNYLKADKLGRRQLKWVMLGFYLAFVPAMLVSAIIIAFPSQFNLYALSSIGMPIIPIMFLVAITKCHLFDIDRMIGGTISYSILVVLIAVLAEAVVEPLVGMTGAQYGYDGNMVQIVFVGALAAVLIPVQRKWRPLIDRVFFSDSLAIEASIEALIEKLEGHDDARPKEWIDLVGRDIANLYHLDGWVVYRFESGKVRLAINEGKGPMVGLDEHFWTKYERRVRPGSEKLEDNNNYLFVPIRPSGSLEWLIVFGPKTSGDVYTPTDNGLIASVAHIVAGEIADHTLPA